MISAWGIVHKSYTGGGQFVPRSQMGKQPAAKPEPTARNMKKPLPRPLEPIERRAYEYHGVNLDRARRKDLDASPKFTKVKRNVYVAGDNPAEMASAKALPKMKRPTVVASHHPFRSLGQLGDHSQAGMHQHGGKKAVRLISLKPHAHGDAGVLRHEAAHANTNRSAGRMQAMIADPTKVMAEEGRADRLSGRPMHKLGYLRQVERGKFGAAGKAAYLKNLLRVVR